VRVLIVAASLDILGGQAVQAERLIRHLQNEPSVHVSFLPINPRLPGILRKLQSIKYVRTVTTSILYCLNLLRHTRKYDVIHIFSASYLSFLIAPTPAIVAGKLYGKKILLNYHSGEAEDHLTRWRRSAIPILKLADQITVPSEYLVRVFAKFGLRSEAILNFVDLSRFPFRERIQMRPKFLSNRNLEAHYGIDDVLRAFKIIQQRLPEAELTVVGDGSERQNLEALKSEIGLNRTKFLGQIPHEGIQEAYNWADIFLNASHVDNQPLSILEAFASGLPVVSTNAGGIPDMVTDGVTGYLVECGDYQSLAERAVQMLDDPSTTSRLANSAYIECQKYRWEEVRTKWLRQYYRLMNRSLPSSTS
jgi:glycosyltransferase involved in cell wall biosynthesis